MVAPRRSDESLLNRAYACFAFLGVATLPVGVGALLSVLHWMSFDEGTNGGSAAMLFGMVVAPLLFAAMVVASAYGIRQTVRFRHPALIVLSVVSIVCGAGQLVALPFSRDWNTGRESPIVEDGMGIAFGIYIAANIMIPAWWFLKGRRSPIVNREKEAK